MKLKYYLRGLGTGIIVTAIVMSFIKKPEELTDAEIRIRAMKLGMVEKNVLADIQEDNTFLEDSVKEDSGTETVSKSEELEHDLPMENVEDADSAEESLNMEKTEATSNNNETEKTEVTSNNNETEKTEATSNNNETEKTEATSNNNETEKTEATSNNNETGKTEATSNNNEIEHIEEGSNNKIIDNVEKYIIIKIEPGNGSETVCQRLFEAGLINSVEEYNKFLIQNGYDRILRGGNHEIPVGATEEEMAKILCQIN